MGAPQVPAGYEVKKKGHFWRNAGIGCGGLIALAIIIAIASGSGSTKSTPATADKSPSATVTTKSTATPAHTAQTLLDVSGSGTKTTQKFTAAHDWDFNWSYDCANFGQGQGNFQVFVYSGDGTLSFANAPVNQLGAKGSDVEHYHTGGTFYLTINSECSWHVTATG